MKKRIGLSAVLCIAALALEAMAGSLLDLDNNQPTKIEDATPTPYKNRELQWFGQYERDGGKETFKSGQSFELGILRNTELEISSPLKFGDNEKNSGDINIEGLYNFNAEGLYLPAMAIKAGITAPSGKDSHGVDTLLGFIASKKITKDTDSIHFNALWGRNFSPTKTERENTYLLGVGYSRRLGPDTLLILDIYRETQKDRNVEHNMGEIGIRWKLTPQTTLNTGIGVGVGDESPDLRVTIGIQRQF